MTEQTSANRSNRGWQPISGPLQRVLKAALVSAALQGHITPQEAQERIQRYGLKAA